MNLQAPLPILLGGPSGVGKSCLGKFLNSQGYLHLESDRYEGNGITTLGLKGPWDAFERDFDPEALARALGQRRGQAPRIILGLASTALSPEHLRRAFGMLQITFLSGPGAMCMESFIARKLPEGVSREKLEPFWHENNDELIRALASPEFAAHKIEAIRDDGQRIALDELAQRLVSMAGNATA